MNVKKNSLIISALFLVSVFFVSYGVNFLIFKNLRTDYLINPIGLDNDQPRFSWELVDNSTQSFYRIVVSENEGFGTLVWDSGLNETQNNVATYSGRALKSFTRYYWRVELSDINKNQKISPVQFFDTGFLKDASWKGSWISDDHDIAFKPAPYFRKSFYTGRLGIKSATAFIAVGGLYELEINGDKIGNHRLDPAFTRFDRRLLYATFDVTSYINQGENTIGVVLGNGWFNHQSTAVWHFDKAPWRNRPTFCMDLRIVYTDGTVETVSTDKTWKTSPSPIIFNSIYTAEHYDARLAIQGWSKNMLNDSSWNQVKLRSSPSTNIAAQAMHPIRNTLKILPKHIEYVNDSITLIDFGRNISGVTELMIQGERGTSIKLEHGERLDENGRLDMSNINLHYRPTDELDPFQTDIVILSGKQDTFMPKFNYKGFQYVEITVSKPMKIKAENIAAYFMHSDVPVVGNIKSSNLVLNKVWEATNNAYLSNLFGYPTDCPQREKNGWTGDAHIALETGLYNFDGVTIYEKWIQDHIDEQQPNGVFPAIVPTSGWGYQWANGLDWTSTIAIIPWNLYLFYGDTTLLARSYNSLKKYINYVNDNFPDGLTDWGLGDWVPVKTTSNIELTSSIYYYVDVDILSKSAKLLGYNEDATYYSVLADKIRKAINYKYLDSITGIYANGTQTELSMPLYWGVVTDEMKTKVAANLALKVQANNYHLDVGLLGSKSILNALSENGYPDIAYKIASQEEYPSWGWWIKNGATTLYENWDLEASNDISMNHIMFGEIGAWYFKGLAGIKPLEHTPGFESFELKPFIPQGLADFSASYSSVRGEIDVSWRSNEGEITMNINIPSNSNANFILPIIENKIAYLDNKEILDTTIKLQPGAYVFVFK